MPAKFSNNASGVLASGISAVATSVTITSGGSAFPTLIAGEYFYASLIDSSNNIEIVQVTAHGAGSNTFTIVRAQEGTSGIAFLTGSKFELRLTAAGLNSFVQKDSDNTLTGANTFNGNGTYAGTNTFNGRADLMNVNNVLKGASLDITGLITMATRKVDAFPAGTKLLFQQSSAPTGWTKDTTHNDKALRVVSGSAGSGGSQAFTTAFSNNRTITVGNLPNFSVGVTITDPGHSHTSVDGPTGGLNPGDYTTRYNWGTVQTGVSMTGITASGAFGNSQRGGAQTGMDFSVQYVDVIIATKDA